MLLPLRFVSSSASIATFSAFTYIWLNIAARCIISPTISYPETALSVLCGQTSIPNPPSPVSTIHITPHCPTLVTRHYALPVACPLLSHRTTVLVSESDSWIHHDKHVFLRLFFFLKKKVAKNKITVVRLNPFRKTYIVIMPLVETFWESIYFGIANPGQQLNQKYLIVFENSKNSCL